MDWVKKIEEQIEEAEYQIQAAKEADNIKYKNQYLLQAVKKLLAGVCYEEEVLAAYYTDPGEVNALFSSFCHSAIIACEFFKKAQYRFNPNVLTNKNKLCLEKVVNEVVKIDAERKEFDIITAELYAKRKELEQKSGEYEEKKNKIRELEEIEKKLSGNVLKDLEEQIDSIQKENSRLECVISDYRDILKRHYDDNKKIISRLNNKYDVESFDGLIKSIEERLHELDKSIMPFLISNECDD